MSRARYSRLAGTSVALFLGVLLFTLGGGLIILAAFGGIAVAPRWFARADPEPAPAVAGGSTE